MRREREGGRRQREERGGGDDERSGGKATLGVENQRQGEREDRRGQLTTINNERPQ